jgi:protein involved in polysaccharide export with SLBB domain
MIGHDTLPNRAGTKRQVVQWLGGCLGVTAVLIAGCKEYRISQAEFMAMPQVTELEAAGFPATQPCPPTTLPAEELETINRVLGPYKVGVGDLLGIDIIGPEQAAARAAAPAQVVLGGPGGGIAGGISGVPVRVDRNGKIRLPQTGQIDVAGLELEDVEATVLHKLIEHRVYTDPDEVTVNVTVAAPYTTDVLVEGAATVPGVVRLRRSERNLFYAMSAAGGATQIASGKVTIKRLRQPGCEQTFDLYDPEELRAALTAAPLENGDIISVLAAQPNTVFVGGLVNFSGPQTYPPGTHVTVLQALAAASGLRTDLFPHEATLIRRVSGQDVHVKLNLDHITKGRDPNLVLAAGDVLWVPFTVDTRIEDWLNKNFFLRFGASATANYGLDYQMPGVDYLNNAAKNAAFGGYNNASTIQQTYDPFGFLLRNQALQTLQSR